jgi:phenylpropionate dioxygenase-like ring-hydroxylating dioxygenase large terminal subunit
MKMLTEAFNDVAARLLAHHENDTTDQTAEITTLSTEYYLDADLWRREVDLIFKRLPIMLGFSCELKETGAYKAMTVVETPVILMRGSDGKARAFLNVCIHRGTLLKPDGKGECRRLVCPYHAWTYDDKGALVGIADAQKFGDYDKTGRGLTELPCEERAGMIWVVLTPGLPLDLESYLGEMLRELEWLEIDTWSIYEQRRLDCANWKAAHDGYVDGYHIEFLHANTIATFSKGDVNTFDAFGPHQRIGFANQDIAKLKKIPRADWVPNDGYTFVRTIFPHVSLAVTKGGGGLISQLFPGPTPDTSYTIQSHIYAHLPQTDEERALADASVEMIYGAVRDEDYAMVSGIQRGMESGAIKEVVFGRNEMGNRRLHDWIKYYSQKAPDPAQRPNP